MALVRGPFTLQYGANTLAGIEEINIDYEPEENDVSTVQGNTYTIRGAIKVSATLTFLETDIPSLAVVLPQYFVPNGGTLSDGSTVTCPDGAIDIVAATCSSFTSNDDLVIEDCTGNTCNRFTIRDAITEVDEISFEDGVRKVAVKFTSTVASPVGPAFFGG